MNTEITECNGWVEATVSLAYRVGELTLHKHELRGFANRTHFSKLTPYSTYPAPRADSAPRANFYFYPTYPIAFTPAKLNSSDGWLTYTPATFKNYFVDLAATGTFSDYLKKFSAKSRSTLLRKVRKFDAMSLGGAQFATFLTPESMGDFFRLAAPLAASTYQARLLGNALPSDSKFVASARDLAALGKARGYLLLLDGRPVAYVFCFVENGVATYDYVGFDPNTAELSPGTVLQYHVLQSMFEGADIKLFDFTEGEGAHKEFFSTGFTRCAKSYLLPAGLVSSAIFRSHAALNYVTEAAGRILEKQGLKSLIRAQMRGRV